MKRRNFIKSLGAVASASMLPLNSLSARTAPLSVTELIARHHARQGTLGGAAMMSKRYGLNMAAAKGLAARVAPIGISVGAAGTRTHGPTIALRKSLAGAATAAIRRADETSE